MNQFPFWPLVVVFAVAWALNIVGTLATKLTLWISRKKWETDEELLAHEKAIDQDPRHKELIESRTGRAFDPWFELARAIANRDWKKAQKVLELERQWGGFIHWCVQLVIIYFAYGAYVDNDLKHYSCCWHCCSCGAPLAIASAKTSICTPSPCLDCTG